MKRALDILTLLGDLARHVVQAIRDDDPERVERILPDTLRTTLAKARADLAAEEEFARRRAMTAALPGEGQP